jgi:hypothetical protein
MSLTKKVETSVILEQTHHSVLSILHKTVQKEAERYSTILQHQPFNDYFYENTPINQLSKNQYMDKINYYSQLRLTTGKNDSTYIGILLTTEAYFPPLYAIDMAWNLRDNYYLLWDSVDELMDKISYSTTWTVSYKSPSFSFICESMDNLYDFLIENEDEDKNELEKANQLINQLLKPSYV